MTRLTTALLAGAFSLAATPAFAQVNAGAGTSSGAITGGSSGATKLNASIGGKAKASGVKTAVGIDASGNVAIRLKESENATGGASGSGARGGIK